MVQEVWELQEVPGVAVEVVLLVRVEVGQEGEVHPVRVGEEEEEDQGQVEEEEEAFLLLEEEEELELGEEEEQEQWWMVETLAEPDSWDKAAVSQSCVSCTPPSGLRPWT